MKRMKLSTLKRADVAGRWCRLIAERPLTPAEADEFERWFAADPAHRSAFELATFLWKALGGSASVPGLLDMRMTALAALAAPKGNGEGGPGAEPDPEHRSAEIIPIAWWRRPTVHRTGIAALAASFVAAISLIVMQPGAAPQGTSYATALGERRVVMLGDGSRVSMDAASQVSVAYSADKRELELRSGRAKFDVAKDPLKPFMVAAGDKLIVATGTSFSVEILNGEVNVVLFEGHVAVLDRVTKRPAVVTSSGRIDAPDALLKPGQELSMHANGVGTLESVDVDMARSWEAGQLSFEAEPLAQAVERLNRYSKTRFTVGDAEASRVAISGVFNSDDIEGFVADMPLVFPVRTVRRGDEVIFYSKR